MLLLLDSLRRLGELLRLPELSAAVAGGVTAVLAWVLPSGTAERVADAIQLQALARGTVYTIAWLAVAFAGIFLLELATGADRSAYRSRTFLQDLLYTLFYQGGFYAILIWAAVANALGPRLEFLKIEVLAGLPGPVHWVLYWLVVDFITYWWHRWLHAWPVLWAFHSVHHSQEEMSFITSNRMHPVEQIGQNLIMVVPLLVMGVPTWRWFPLFVARNILEAAQHSALDWGYGRAYYLVVSPRFHALHHSTDPRHHHRNFSKILSVWDFMFGTAVQDEQRPAKLGVEGMPVPRSIGQQLVAPFRILLQRRTRATPPVAQSAS